MRLGQITGLIALLGTAGPLLGSPYVLLEGVDEIALEQPRVAFLLLEPSTPPGEGDVVGPTGIFNTALLDTGAQAILLAVGAYRDEFGDVNPNLYEQATGANGGPAQYQEIGVAGPELVNVYVPHDLVFAGSNGSPLVLPAVTPIGKPALDFGSFSAILGTPAMQGRATTLDLTGMANFDLDSDFIEVSFSNAAPAPVPGQNYHFNLSRYPAEPTGLLHPDDPAPTLGDLPIIDGIGLSHGSSTPATANLIMDTGGQLSILSRTIVESLGIDPEEDAVDFLEVSGLGGTTLVPLVYIDQITLPTAEGVDLVVTDLLVGVVDIEGLDGVLGMNVLTSGYLEALGTADPNDLGWFTDVVFDFSSDDWTMRLGMNPEFNVVVPEPATASALLFTIGGVYVARRRTA